MLVTALAMLSALQPIQPPSRASNSRRNPGQAQPQSSPSQCISSAAGPLPIPAAEPLQVPADSETQQEPNLSQTASEQPRLSARFANLMSEQATDKAQSSASCCEAGDQPNSSSEPPAAVITHAQELQAGSQSSASAEVQGTASVLTQDAGSALTAEQLQLPSQQLGFQVSQNRPPPAASEVSQQAPVSIQDSSLMSGADTLQSPEHAVEDTFLQHQIASSPSELAELAQHYPRKSPYKGYRVDLVALLANLSFRRGVMQQKVNQLGRVELILSQCQVGPCLPYLEI